MNFIKFLLFVFCLTINLAQARTSAPHNAEVYIISPTDGEKVSSPFTVKFGLKGMGIAPAGVDRPNTGHHHLLINAPLPSLELPVPMDKRHRHYGGGQTETSLELAPGTHTLRLIMGDHVHIPHEPAIFSDEITVIVE